jgi:hypothetical protein
MSAPTQIQVQALLADIERRFEAKLQAKTGWGRNEVMEVFRASVLEAVVALMTLDF